MKIYTTGEYPVSVVEYAQGTALFNKLVLSDSRTSIGMARAFAATICAKVSHAILNEQQHEKYPDAPVIVSFAPGFQLDVNAYSNMVKAFNATGIPFFVAPSLPQGKTAFAYSEHPEQLVRSLTHFTEELAANRPKTQIIALGHSYGAAQQAHAWYQVGSSLKARVIPVTYQGMLRDVGVMACALPHSPLYPIPRDIFRGKDPFLKEAHQIMSDTPHALFGFDPNDGYMDQERQLGGILVDDPRVLVLDGKMSPGHYGDSFKFTQNFASRVLTAILKR